MTKKHKNIALFSPNEAVYSETFVYAHKTMLDGNVFYYYGTRKDIKLENSTMNLHHSSSSLLTKISRKLKKPDTKYLRWSVLIQSMITNDIDVILIEFGPHAHNLLPFLEQVDIPFVVHFHGYDASVDSVIKECDNYSEVFERAASVIVVSTEMRERLINLGCEASKITYTPCGPNDAFLEVTPTYTKKQFVGIGRFVDKKAPYFTILAFAKALKEVPDAKLLLAGNGPLLNTCQNLVAYHQMTAAVSFLGIIKPDTFRNILSESRAYVQHSITSDIGDMEGTPVAIMEAQASGLPVISTRHGGIRDVIVEEETGLLCDEKDVDEMAKLMIRLLKNKSEATTMGQNGRKRVLEKYTISHHIQTIDEVLENAILQYK
ncbi:glycosyltransferase family 4 protein [uncultured Dokdonia sp.]|uniref:glycosyltransferase family 4 protein n=1 Tax=uncultured Dokdonia sp. TaxID=575653 RepID=UPI002614C73A|nr:glycosyltransferase family 4 protein [uncultured Dokdonia sp.]